MGIDVAGLSDEMLVSQLRGWSARVAAGQALMLRLIAELDAREAWAPAGALSCAHWVSWQLGLSLPTAREKVRVGRALRELPLLSAELATGRVSYAQVRAITRIATAADEQRWVELAAFTTAAQLERAVRGLSRARGDGARRGRDLPAARVAWDEDGTLVLTLRIGPASAPGVLAALESARSAEQTDRDALYAALGEELVAGPVEPVDVSAETSAPDAPPYAEPYDFVEPPHPKLTPMVGLFEQRPAGEQEALAEYWAETERRRARQFAARAWADHVATQAASRHLPGPGATFTDGFVRALTRPEGLPPVTVTLLHDPLSGWARTRACELLPPSSLAQIFKTLPGRTRRTTSTVLDLGRGSRLVSRAQREYLGQLDGERCRFPSCTRTTHLHAHHVRFWRDGGPTDLANLVLVCSRHHTLIHSEGFQLVLSPDRTLTVRTAADIPVPHHRVPETEDGDQLPADVEAFASGWQGDRLDLGYVVMVLAQQSS